MFDGVNSGQVDDFANTLAHDFAKRFPPDLENVLDKKQQKKLVSAINVLYARAGTFSREHSMGVYKKAKFGNTLKWELKALGYSAALIDKITSDLMMALAAD